MRRRGGVLARAGRPGLARRRRAQGAQLPARCLRRRRRRAAGRDRGRARARACAPGRAGRPLGLAAICAAMPLAWPRVEIVLSHAGAERRAGRCAGGAGRRRASSSPAPATARCSAELEAALRRAAQAGVRGAAQQPLRRWPGARWRRGRAAVGRRPDAGAGARRAAAAPARTLTRADRHPHAAALHERIRRPPGAARAGRGNSACERSSAALARRRCRMGRRRGPSPRRRACRRRSLARRARRPCAAAPGRTRRCVAWRPVAAGAGRVDHRRGAGGPRCSPR